MQHQIIDNIPSIMRSFLRRALCCRFEVPSTVNCSPMQPETLSESFVPRFMSSLTETEDARSTGPRTESKLPPRKHDLVDRAPPAKILPVAESKEPRRTNEQREGTNDLGASFDREI
jgi:hypothetical protein